MVLIKQVNYTAFIASKTTNATPVKTDHMNFIAEPIYTHASIFISLKFEFHQKILPKVNKIKKLFY